MRNSENIFLVIVVGLAIYIFIQCYFNWKNTETFTNNANGKYQACLFWASWCGHCKDVKPKWETMKSTIQNNNVEILEIQCDNDDNNDKCKIYTSGRESDIGGFPTMTIRKLDSNDNVIKEVEYEKDLDKNISGNREPDDLIKFINYYSKNL